MFATRNATRKLCIINSSLESQPNFVYDSTGEITGYKTKVGADTVFPFKSGVSYAKVRIKTHNNYDNYIWLYIDLYDKNDGLLSTKLIYQGYLNKGTDTTWDSR